MKNKVLIVEDQFIEANQLQLMLENAGYEVCGIARSVAIAEEMIKKEKPELVLLDIFLKGKQTGIDLARELSTQNIAFIYLSANSNEEVLNAAKETQPYGFLVKPFRERDLLITLEIAHYRHEHSLESELRKENILKEKLAAIISGATKWEDKLLEMARVFQPCIPFDYFFAGFFPLPHFAGGALSLARIGYDEYQQIGIAELSTMTGNRTDLVREMVNTAITDQNSGIQNADSFERSATPSSFNKLVANIFGLRSKISLPLRLSKELSFNLVFYSREPNGYNSGHEDLLTRLQKKISESIEKMQADWQPGTASQAQRDQPVSDSVKIGARKEFAEIVGKSRKLLNVFDHITQVAPTDTSVLILGESGTGKERIADSIHNLSPRKNKPFIKVNCAALPATLIESELFGHEKGAFTGAADKRIGKFEKADKGTIFLDEIGEMPLDLQVKLLRVLQEKTIERIGSREPTTVDVRVIAATNRNLEREVAERRFRLDLYYRLNVFPIELPALRERAEDIPVLAKHFIDFYNRKAGKKITGLSDKVVKALMEYSWPGNIRELEHLIERSVLLEKGTIIENIMLPTNPIFGFAGTDDRPKTIHENERDHIISILKKCNGRIWGRGGAADILNLPPSTLKSKMKKLGIHKENNE